MKIIILMLLILNLLFGTINAHTYQWRLLPNSPGNTGSDRFEDMSFINDNTGWVVGYNGTVNRTTNGGATWPTIFNSTFGNQFRSVGFFDANTGLIGTLITDTNRILYRTTDGGFSWTSITNILPYPKPLGICGMSIVNGSTAYACGRYYGPARIVKTTDKGASWTSVFSDSSMARTLIDCYFWTADSGIAVGGYNISTFSTGNAVIIKTTNGGATWQRVCKTTRAGEWCWKISFISRNIGFVSIERETGGPAFILKTTNNGLNWSEISFVNGYDEEGIGFLNESTGWVGGWTGPTYQTTNGGANWQLAGWGTNMNRFRFMSDTLAYAVGDRVYKYSSGLVIVQPISNEIPSSFNLYQNYPNPFNPVTKIQFDIPSNNENVRLMIYDNSGRVVQALLNQRLKAGSYEVEFSGNNLSSGLYFYKLEYGDFAITKKMLLIK